MKKTEPLFHLILAVEGLLSDLEHVAEDCATSGDAMGLYLLDVALEECRTALEHLRMDANAD